MADIYQGLEEDIIEIDGGKPFGISTYECTKCGNTDDYKDDEVKCHTCNYQLSKKVKKDLKKDTVKGIIDRKVVYKCPECKKEYFQPEQCCVKEFSTEGRIYGKNHIEYLCTGCNNRYIKPVTCCPGSLMVQGKVYPEMSMEEFKKIRSSILKPVTGIIQ